MASDNFERNFVLLAICDISSGLKFEIIITNLILLNI